MMTSQYLSTEQFEMLWSLNPNGHKEKIYSIVNEFLSRKIIINGNQEMNFERFYILYKKYVEFLEDKQAGKYTKNEYTILPIDVFIEKGLYNKTYEAPKRVRDAYLFGDFKDSELMRKFREFKTKYGNI